MEMVREFVCRYNDTYWCKVWNISAEVDTVQLLCRLFFDFEARGDNSIGSLQDPGQSLLKKG